MTDKEKTLLSGCLNQEKTAWDAFVLQYSALVYHTIKKTFAFYHTEPRPDLVEDLFQEFFLSLLRDDFKKVRQFRGDPRLQSGQLAKGGRRAANHRLFEKPEAARRGSY